MFSTLKLLSEAFPPNKYVEPKGKYANFNQFNKDALKVQQLLQKAFAIVDSSDWADFIEKVDNDFLNFGSKDVTANKLDKQLIASFEQTIASLKKMNDFFESVAEHDYKQ